MPKCVRRKQFIDCVDFLVRKKLSYVGLIWHYARNTQYSDATLSNKWFSLNLIHWIFTKIWSHNRKTLYILRIELPTFMSLVSIMETEYVLCEVWTKAYCWWYEPTLHKKGSVNRVPHPLQGKYRKYNVSPFARGVWEMRYLAVYDSSIKMRYLAVYESSTRNTISRRLREQHKKYDISPFTRAAQEIPYLAA